MSRNEGEGSSTPTRNGLDVPNGAVSPTRASAPPSLLRPFIPRFVLSVLNMPRSLWRVLSLQDTPSTPPDPRLSLPPTPTHRLSSNSLTSLTSSRPAPPSPAVSRRASGLSRTSSRPVSGASSRPPSALQPSRPTSGAIQPTTPTPMITSIPTTPRPPTHLTPEPTTAKLAPPTPTTTATTSVFIQIRDYGFTQTDPRFTGQGPNVPRANRPTVLARRLASTSRSSRTSSSEGDNSDDDYEDVDDKGTSERINIDGDEDMWQDEDDGVNGWPGFKWGFERGWGFRPASGGSGFPSRGDLDRNFGGEDEDEDEDEEMEIDDSLSDEEVYDAESELPLLPGVYRALYAFEPEGTAEMKLDEDQLVRLIGRGGGVGWAVVVKDGLKDTGVHALVPESYLELVRLDGDEDLES